MLFNCLKTTNNCPLYHINLKSFYPHASFTFQTNTLGRTSPLCAVCDHLLPSHSVNHIFLHNHHLFFSLFSALITPHFSNVFPYNSIHALFSQRAFLNSLNFYSTFPIVSKQSFYIPTWKSGMLCLHLLHSSYPTHLPALSLQSLVSLNLLI